MDQRVIVVSETAPRLKRLEASEAREFLREYDSYCNRIAETELPVPMRRLLESDDLEMLLILTQQSVPAEGAPRVPDQVIPEAAVVADLGPDLAAERADNGDAVSVGTAGSSSSSSLSGTTVEAIGLPARLSNLHIAAMLVTELGPADVVEAGEIFENIKMSKHDNVYSSMSNALQYIRDWQNAERWCSRHLPRPKFLVKQFIRGVYPRKLKGILEMRGEKKIGCCPGGFSSRIPGLGKSSKGVAEHRWVVGV